MAVDPDSVFEPIEGMLYVGTTRSRTNGMVKVVRTTPQTVIYMPVGKGVGGRERRRKSSRDKFVHTHAPGPHTPPFVPTVAAKAAAIAEVRATATAFVVTQDVAAEAAVSKEAPVPVSAPISPAPAEPPRAEPVYRASEFGRPSRFSPEQVREMYLLAADTPAGVSRTAHLKEIGRTYGCSSRFVELVYKGESLAPWTADLRLRHLRPADEPPQAAPISTPPLELRAEALPKAEERPRAVSGQVVEAGGHAQVNVPRFGDGPPPPPSGPSGRAVIGEAATLLTDAADLIQQLARCVMQRRPLPTYLPMRTVEEMAGRCEAVAERLTEVGGRP